MGLFAKRTDSRAHDVEFLHDQDGPMERLIKQKLSEFFRDVVQVEEAYFARVMYGGNVQSVALCVYGSPEMDTQLVMRGVQQVYQRAVNTDQGLQTIFLTALQHADVVKVCKSFYRSPALKQFTK